MLGPRAKGITYPIHFHAFTSSWRSGDSWTPLLSAFAVGRDWSVFPASPQSWNPCVARILAGPASRSRSGRGRGEHHRFSFSFAPLPLPPRASGQSPVTHKLEWSVRRECLSRLAPSTLSVSNVLPPTFSRAPSSVELLWGAQILLMPPDPGTQSVFSRARETCTAPEGRGLESLSQGH